MVALRPQIDQRLQILRASVQWRQEKGYDAGKQAEFMDRGQQAMEQVRQTCSEMIETERKLLDLRRAESLDGIRRTTRMTLTGTAISVGILSWAFVLLVRENGRRRAAEEALMTANNALEQRVAE